MFNQKFTDFGLLLPRLFVGFTLAFAHGMGKLPPSGQFLAGVQSIGFPLPIVFAWAAALAEFLGGLLLGLGLFTRIASFFVGFTMLTAALGAHAKDPFARKEMALLYLAFAVLYFFVGPGRFSLDYKLFKK